MSGMPVQFRPTVGFAFESLTVANTVQVLTPSLYQDSVTTGGASSAFLTNETSQIRFRYDGVAPTSTVGHILEAGGILVLNGQQQMKDFKCIRTGSTSSTISITYERI